MALIWKNHLSVSNAVLDSEHKELLGLINSIEYAINVKDSCVMLNAIKKFKRCLDSHFLNEMQFAREFGIRFTDHSLAHQHMQKELQHTINQLEGRAGTWPEYVVDHYSQFLRGWLVEHITQEDMLMKPLLQTRPYEFMPEFCVNGQ